MSAHVRDRLHLKIKRERTIDTRQKGNLDPFVFGVRQISVTGVCALKRHEKPVRVTLVQSLWAQYFSVKLSRGIGNGKVELLPRDSSSPVNRLL